MFTVLEKKHPHVSKWTHTVQTQVAQGSIVHKSVFIVQYRQLCKRNTKGKKSMFH